MEGQNACVQPRLWQPIYTKPLNAFSDYGVRLAVIPKEFFVTSGKATSPVSELNAFDLSLKNAGIAQCNLVAVSSILPPHCTERRWRKLPAGAITHAVVARFDGGEGTTIGAGIAWAWERNGEYGIVAEAHGHMDRKALEETLAKRIKEMAEIRGIETKKAEFRVEVLRVPEGNYGCVLAALVYCPTEKDNLTV